ncbi:A/G-specific adenine glycosylase [Papillibacter cinnamivorans]|uniref:Adenine DNA glycosylase n=1 Tax=Papillibacter cinnamivorans DSM 12816 TaxID=1122930 RepID=A0A1W2A6H2_9FIRM|nr:A/G-specific adenine glycosylase [Papillibacter cinnamivorans]SMC56173.1 A/G-specific DNA-adenine glycosylase [Papillibacter cinnamivorans DSM 12816]
MENRNFALPEDMVPSLLRWYDKSARTLPWRSDPSPYRVWVSEIMLQQTRVAAVIERFETFLRELPDLEALAAAGEGELMKLWEGLGYYSRARNMQKAARSIMERCEGRFPSAFEEILRLPGVGEYTAGAVSSIAFGLPVPAVDGNVLRVVSRLTASDTDIGRPEVKKSVGDAIRKIIPHSRPGDFNQALMDLGAEICLPNGAPLCSRCPLSSFCEGYRRGVAESLPVKTAKKPRRRECRTVFLVFSPLGVALRRRPDRGLLAGLWEFPGENGFLSAEEAVPVLQSWGLNVRNAVSSVKGFHVFTHVEWDMTGIMADAAPNELPACWRWADARALREELAVPSAFRAYLEEALRHMEGA